MRGQSLQITQVIVQVEASFQGTYIKPSSALLTTGFTQSSHNYSLFILKKDIDIVIALVYVDDLLITSSNDQLINIAKEVLHQQFKHKDLGQLKYFLGIEVLRSSEGVILNQRKYIL